MTEQTNQLTLEGRTLFSALNLEENKFTAMASISCPDAPETDDDDDMNDDTRAPVLLVAVVDKSGSMSGDKIKSLKETLQFIIKEMSKRDRLAIVEYDTNVYTTLPLTFMDDVGKTTATRVATALRTGSSTNMSGGLLTGLELIPSEIDNNTVVSTLLMTDGHANVGIKTSSGMIAMMRDLQQKGQGRCTVNTFGFGTGHNATMLKEIADAAEGMYYFIQDADSIATSFADCLGGLLSVSAQGIELVIEACGDNTIGRIHTPKEITELTAGKKYRVSLGDLQEGENRDIPFNLTIASCSTATSDFPVVELSLSYFNMKTESMGSASATVTICRDSNLTAEQKTANLEVNKHCNRILAADAAEAAVALANKGEIEEARKCLQSAIDEIANSPSSNDDLCKGLIQELETSKSGLVSRTSYQRDGQYQMNKFSKAMKMQRCAASSQPAADCISFETSKRRKMKSKFSKR